MVARVLGGPGHPHAASLAAAARRGFCAFTTKTSPPSCRAASSASNALVARMPRGTATPDIRRICFAWYSWVFISGPWVRT